MIFTNSRRLAERLAGSLNETAGEEIALAHHGSVAREKRLRDRGAAEARRSPGDRRDLVARARDRHGSGRSRRPDRGAALDRLRHAADRPRRPRGRRAFARDPLSEVPRGPARPRPRPRRGCRKAGSRKPPTRATLSTSWPSRSWRSSASAPARVDELYRLVRGAAPFAELPRSSFEGVLDMLSGRYPSDEFAELRPRVTWDRTAARCARAKARGTWPSSTPERSRTAGCTASSSRRRRARGLRGARASASSTRRWSSSPSRATCSSSAPRPGGSRRSRTTGSWCRPRRGCPAGCRSGTATGRAGRPSSARRSASSPAASSPRSPTPRRERLREEHGLDARAAANLIAYLEEQDEATGEVPSDRTLVVERYQDDIGDWRVCVLSPWGARVHAPWATAVLARAQGVARRRHRGALVGRRHGLPRPRVRRAARGLALPPGRGRDRGPRRAESRRELALRRAVPRERRARAPASAAAPGAAQSPLGAAQARRGPARGGLAVRVVSDHSRDVPGVPPRRLRPARAGRDPSPDRVRGRSASSRATPARRRRSPPRSCSPTSPTSSTTPTPRSPSDGPRRSRSIRRSCASSSARRSCASSSTPRRSGVSSARLQRLEGRRVRHADGLHDLLLSLGDLTRGGDPRRGASLRPTSPRWLESLARERRIIAVHDRGRSALRRGGGRGEIPRRARRRASARAARGVSRGR